MWCVCIHVCTHRGGVRCFSVVEGGGGGGEGGKYEYVMTWASWQIR